MKDSFTLDEFILYSAKFLTNSDNEMVGEQREHCSSDQIAPDKRVVQNILSYSKALSVMKTKCAGNINLLLN